MAASQCNAVYKWWHQEFLHVISDESHTNWPNGPVFCQKCQATHFSTFELVGVLS